MRSIYEKGKIGRLTQGSIITGCIAEDFPNRELFGCIITPRCDLDHEGKISTVHYLPIVPFEDWFIKKAIPEVFTNWKSDLSGNIDNIMKENGFGEKITSLGLEKEDLVKLAESKLKGKALDGLKKKIEEFYSKHGDQLFKDYLCQEKGKHVDCLKQLKENKIASCYLLEKWNDACSSDYYVILLRDVRRLSVSTASKISNGVLEQDLSPINPQFDDLFISKTSDGFYYVDSQIQSPFIEHILAAFVYNFNRIGVEDLPSDTHNSLVKIASHIKI